MNSTITTSNSASDSSPRLCLDTTTSAEAAWLYSLVPSPPSNFIGFGCIHPILPSCGVHCLKRACTFDSREETCQLFTQTSVGGNFNSFSPGSQLLLFAPKSNNVDWRRFVFSTCVGNGDSRGDETRSRIDTMRLTPIFLTLQLAMSGNDGLAETLKLKFYPGVTSYFDVKDMESRENEKWIVYHSMLAKSDGGWSSNLDNFQSFRAGEGLPSIQIKGVEALPFPPEEDLGPNKLFSPFTFTIVSYNGREHQCHKDVLAERTSLFASPFLNPERVEVSEGEKATDIVLHQIYFPQKSLPPNLSFEELTGILKLAYEFGMEGLIGRVGYLLNSELGTNEQDPTAYWKLADFICTPGLRDGMQILWKIWRTLLTTIKRLILQVQFEYIFEIRFDCSDYILNLTSFYDCGPNQVQILEKLSTDLEEKTDGETNQQFMLVQSLFKRFLIHVLKKMPTYYE